MASDYRYDPFNNIAEPINITGETHVIPSNSPYTIRLKEVPVKESPSTVTLTIGGIAATEVAAEPTVGQFRCDYTTGADSDDNWNTGLIQFNAADAGKKVVAAYNGMGTLASIKAESYPAWWLDRGDGSDGDFAPTGNITINGLKQYKSVNIPAGVTVTTGGYPLRILCQGAFINSGTLSSVGNAGATGVGPELTASGGSAVYAGAGGGSGMNGSPGTGGGCGVSGAGSSELNSPGAGGANVHAFTKRTYSGASADSGVINESLRNGTFCFGSGGGGGSRSSEHYHNQGGGGGGAGGGAIQVVADSIKNAGTITVAGGAGGAAYSYVGAGGAGGGGSIILIGEVVIGGTMNVSGGYPGWYRTIELGAV